MDELFDTTWETLASFPIVSKSFTVTDDETMVLMLRYGSEDFLLQALDASTGNLINGFKITSSPGYK